MKSLTAQDIIAQQAYSQELDDKIPVKIEDFLRNPEEHKQPGTVTDSEVSEEMYTVEKILDKRVSDGKVQYLVKWKDYNSDDNEWKGVDELNYLDFMIEEFEKNRKKSRAPSIEKRMQIEKKVTNSKILRKRVATQPI